MRSHICQSIQPTQLIPPVSLAILITLANIASLPRKVRPISLLALGILVSLVIVVGVGKLVVLPAQVSLVVVVSL